MISDHTSKDWLLYCLHEGYSQRKMAALCNVTPPTIRLWLKKHDIKWRNISESLLVQSDEVSARAKKVWSDPSKRKKQSETMIKVQSTRKKELSESAKKNWKNNRDTIICGIKKSANDPKRIQATSERSRKQWQDPEYRKAISDIMKALWENDKHRFKTEKNGHKQQKALRPQHSEDTKAKISKALKELWKTEEYRKSAKLGKEKYSGNHEFIEKCQKAAYKRWQTKEYADKVSQSMLEWWENNPTAAEKFKTDEFKDIQRKKAKKLWNNTEYREMVMDKLQQVAIKNRKTTVEYIEQAKEVHKDRFDYNDTEYTRAIDKVNIKCNFCNHIFRQDPRNHLKHGYCPKCSLSQEQYEIYELMNAFTSCKLNDRETIAPLELDIYAPTHKLAIEHNGLYRHSYNEPETTKQKTAHQRKALLCLSQGIRLIQLFDYEWNNKGPLCHSLLKHALKLSTPLNARKLRITTVSNDDATLFYTQNHLMGHRPAKITLGLWEHNKLIIAMSLNEYNDYCEIIRLATLAGYQVRGGFSRLLYHYRKHSNLPIETYADLRYSTGEVYKKLGFKHINITKPGYFYYRGSQRLSRQQCQKHKLHKLLKNGFNSELSESVNMFINGYRRVWDAGHIKLKLDT